MARKSNAEVAQKATYQGHTGGRPGGLGICSKVPDRRRELQPQWPASKARRRARGLAAALAVTSAATLAVAAAAAGSLRTARAQEPARPAAERFELGRLALERGEAEEAARHLAAAIEGGVPRPYAAWYLLGRARLLQQAFEPALGAFREALRRAPRFAAARVGSAAAAVFLGRTEEAAAELERLATMPDPTAEGLLLHGGLLIHAGRDDAARAVLQRVAGAAGTSPPERRAAELLLVALETEGSQRSTEATRQRLAAALGEDFSLPEAYVALGIARRRDGAASSAVPLFRAALEIDDQDPLPLLFLPDGAGEAVSLPSPAPGFHLRAASAYRAWEEGRREDAARQAEALLAQRPHHVPLRLLTIRHAEESSDLWRALSGYRDLVDRLGRVPALLASAAGVAQTLGAHGAAACAAREALAAGGDDASLHYLLGTAAGDLGDLETAIAEVGRALDLLDVAPETERDRARAWIELGDLHFEQMRVTDSIAAYRRAVEIDPEAAEVIRPFALASLAAADEAPLRELLELHLAAHPGNADTLYSLGVLRLREDDLAGAERAFARLAEVAPEHPQVHYNLGQIHERRGRREEAAAAFERFRALKAGQDAEWERRNQAHFRRLDAEAAERSGRREQALRLRRANVEEGVGELEDLRALGRLSIAAGRPAEGAAWWEQVLATSPADREALAGLAAATAAGDPEESTAARQRLTLLDWPCEALRTPAD